MKKRLSLILLLTLLVGVFQIGVNAAEPVEILNVIRVSDRQFVIEFSEPIKYVDGEPFWGLRIVDANYHLQKTSDDKNAQIYQGTTTFLTEEHDKVLFTVGRAVEDFLTLSGDYADLNNGSNRCLFVVEELLADGEDKEDGTIHNIESIATGTKLSDTITGTGRAYDKNYTAIKTDYTYLDQYQSSPNSSDSISQSQTAPSNSNGGIFEDDSSSPDGENETGANLWLWIGIGAAAVVIAVILLVVARKKKADK